MLVQVEVPRDAAPGSMFQMAMPDGTMMNVTVPPGLKPGATIQVQAPAPQIAAVVAPVAAVPAGGQPVQRPVVQGIVPMFVGPQDQRPLLDDTTAAILSNTSSFTIKQRVKWWEALTQGCIEQSNTYDVFDTATGAHLFIAQEYSDDCARCFCAPIHSVRVEFALVNQPERQWIKGTHTQPAAFHLDREGCCDKPGLACWACGPSCMDGMIVRAGPSLGLKPGSVNVDEQTIGIVDQPTCAGYCTPTFNVRSRQAAGDAGFQPLAKLEGPCIFGGCSELCCSSTFLVSTLDRDVSPNKKIFSGDMARITKTKPRDCKGCAREMFTDSDIYTLEYKEGIGLTPQQKANMMASLILMDYHLFELDHGLCECRNNKLYITFFDYYCCGCACPCQIVLDGNNNGGGG